MGRGARRKERLRRRVLPKRFQAAARRPSQSRSPCGTGRPANTAPADVSSGAEGVRPPGWPSRGPPLRSIRCTTVSCLTTQSRASRSQRARTGDRRRAHARHANRTRPAFDHLQTDPLSIGGHGHLFELSWPVPQAIWTAPCPTERACRPDPFAFMTQSVVVAACFARKAIFPPPGGQTGFQTRSGPWVS